MKCTNNRRLRIIGPIAGILLAIGFLNGCSYLKGESSIYQVYETSSSYHLGISEGYQEPPSLMAADLCVGGEENSDDPEHVIADQTAAGSFDLETGEILYAKDIYEKRYPASTTKILTAYLALKYGDLDDVITVSSSALSIPWDSSVCGLKAGDRISLHDLLYGLLIVSGNDAANVIAEYISGGTKEFCELMNREAEALGAVDSHFVNPHGYPDENHYTTVYDLYLIFQKALKLPEFRDFIGTKKISVTYQNAAGEDVSQEWVNTNWYMNGYAGAPKGFTICGGKTGSSNDSGFCLVLYSTDHQDHDRVSIVLKSAAKESLYQQMTKMLLEF